MRKGTLYLLPNTMGGDPQYSIPKMVWDMAEKLDVFIVESRKEAIRWLVKLGCKHRIEEVEFLEFRKKGGESVDRCIQPLLKGEHVGLLTDAGMPCIADPGGEVVSVCHQMGIQVVPLPGPSSILLGLISSGFSGQDFAFNGYIPIKPVERVKKIKQLCSRVLSGQTQVLMETPYRNQRLFTELLENCPSQLGLSIALNITGKNEWIHSKSIGEWRGSKAPDLHKKPGIFVLGKIETQFKYNISG